MISLILYLFALLYVMVIPMVNYKVKNSHFLWRCSFQNEVTCRCSEYEHRTPILQATVVSRKRVYDATLQGAEKACTGSVRSILRNHS